MGKIVNTFHNLSIRKTIVCYIIVFLIIAIFLCTLTSYVCNNITKKIEDKYPYEKKQFFLTTENGERLGNEGAYISSNFRDYSENDKFLIEILRIIPNVLNPIYSISCAILGIYLFYNNKLRKPLDELNNASNMIANNNLDFSIKYKSNDEMGKLCESFEKMRFSLLENYKEIWRNVEERKKINATFAHELRTPLTILKGYNEILENSQDVQVRETVQVMKKNVDRMEKYIIAMGKMQKLEEVKASPKRITTKDFLNNIKETIKVIGNEKVNIELINNIYSDQLYFDLNMILQVMNNLLSNALQYANSFISITLNEDDNNIYIIVKDDGQGFSKKAIENATNPYYTESKENSYNFGLGLYISKIYSELNNGNLIIYNDNGACVKISLKK